MDGRPIRIKIDAVSKMSGFVWTGPESDSCLIVHLLRDTIGKCGSHSCTIIILAVRDTISLTGVQFSTCCIHDTIGKCDSDPYTIILLLCDTTRLTCVQSSTCCMTQQGVGPVYNFPLVLRDTIKKCETDWCTFVHLLCHTVRKFSS